MQINILVNPTDPADLNAAIQFLNGLVPMEQRDAVRSPSAKPLGVVPVEALDDPQPEKRKPGRKPKQEVAAEPGGKPEYSTSAPTTASSETATTSAPAAPSLSLDDIRAALQKYTQKHSIEAGIELLKKFGAQRVSELPAEKYAEFVGECV